MIFYSLREIEYMESKLISHKMYNILRECSWYSLDNTNFTPSENFDKELVFLLAGMQYISLNNNCIILEPKICTDLYCLEDYPREYVRISTKIGTSMFYKYKRKIENAKVRGKITRITENPSFFIHIADVDDTDRWFPGLIHIKQRDVTKMFSQKEILNSRNPKRILRVLPAGTPEHEYVSLYINHDILPNWIMEKIKTLLK